MLTKTAFQALRHWARANRDDVTGRPASYEIMCDFFAVGNGGPFRHSDMWAVAYTVDPTVHKIDKSY